MIIINGKKLSEYGIICQRGYIHPSTPNISNKELSIPGKDGIYDFGVQVGERRFSFPLALINDNNTYLQHGIRAFIMDLFDHYGKPKTITLVFDYEPDKYYKARCTSQISPDKITRTGLFTIEFTAYDPYAYSQVLADEVLWGSNVITFQSSYKLGRGASDGLRTITGETTLNIIVDGIAVKPVIEIVGSGTNVVLTANGYTITLGTFTGATWVIDCDKYTVLKNGASAFGEVSLRDFILLPGSNTIEIAGMGINFTIRIKARDKYI
jgi:predicted phage tail component-like protein